MRLSNHHIRGNVHAEATEFTPAAAAHTERFGAGRQDNSPSPHKSIHNNHLECISLAVYAQKQDPETPLKMAPSRIKGEAENACRVADAGAGTGQGQGSAPLRPTTTIQFDKKHINDLRFIAEF